MSQDVLVLNSDYVPLNICNSRRAITMMFLGKVDVLHKGSNVLHSAEDQYVVPSVVRLKNHVRRPAQQIKLSRKAIFERDHYTCQYCGQRSMDLTIDHVVPRRLGGGNTWDNLVCCCKKCNNKKSDKTLQQLGITLRSIPYRPKYAPFVSLRRLRSVRHNKTWCDYLPETLLTGIAQD